MVWLWHQGVEDTGKAGSVNEVPLGQGDIVYGAECAALAGTRYQSPLLHGTVDMCRPLL